MNPFFGEVGAAGAAEAFGESFGGDGFFETGKRGTDILNSMMSAGLPLFSELSPRVAVNLDGGKQLSRVASVA